MRFSLSLIALLVYSHPFGKTYAQVKNSTSSYAQNGYLTFDLNPMEAKGAPLFYELLYQLWACPKWMYSQTIQKERLPRNTALAAEKKQRSNTNR